MKTFRIKLMAMVMTLLTSAAIAQTQPEITVTRTVALSADQVWELIRILNNVDKISSLVSKVEFTGPLTAAGGTRVCTNAEGNGYFKEQIRTFSDAERSYTYQVMEGVPARNMINHFKVVDLGYNSSMIVWTSGFDFMENPNMTKDQFVGFLTMAVNEMIDNSLKNAKRT